MITTAWVRENRSIVVYSTGPLTTYKPLASLTLFRDAPSAQNDHRNAHTVPLALLAVYDARSEKLNPLGYAWLDNADVLHGREGSSCEMALLTRDWHFGPWDAITPKGLVRTILANGGTIDDVPPGWRHLVTELKK